VAEELGEIFKHVHRVADDHLLRSLSWLKGQIIASKSQIEELQSKRGSTLAAVAKAKAEVATANAQRSDVFIRYEQPEKDINSGLGRNEIAIALKEPLKKKLETERTNGIERYAACKKVWDGISDLPELRSKTAGDNVDIGAALERLRSSLKQVNEKRPMRSPKVSGRICLQPRCSFETFAKQCWP